MDSVTASIRHQLDVINRKIASECEWLFQEPSAPRDDYKTLCAERIRIETFAHSKGIF